MSKNELKLEFDRQVDNLLQLGYPKIAKVTKKEFLSYLESLKQKVEKLSVPQADFEKGTLPFVIVIKSELVNSKTAMSLVTREGKNGIDIMRPHEPHDFKTIEAVSIPSGVAYIMVDIDRGKETINIIPSEAFKTIAKQKRSPLTIDEGIAIVTQYPDFLKKNNCFSLLASRFSGDQRVPAIWINARKQPNLGWCWDGNPHTWLGSASCGSKT
jgi:Family of unknown function (DUF5701)